MFKWQVINDLKIDKESIVLLCNVIIGVFLIRNGGIEVITWHKIKIMEHQNINQDSDLNMAINSIQDPLIFEKVLHLLKEEIMAYQIKSSMEEERRVVLRTSTSIEFLAIKDIIRCEAEGRYTKVYYGDNGFLYVSMHLKEVVGVLMSDRFVRCHNSHLINKRKIRRYNKTDGGFLELVNGDHVPVARARKETVLSQLADTPV